MSLIETVKAQAASAATTGEQREPAVQSRAAQTLDMVSGMGAWFKPRDRRDLDRMAARYGDASCAMLRGWAG